MRDTAPIKTEEPRRFSISLARFITIVLLGPPIGALVYILVGTIIERPAFFTPLEMTIVLVMAVALSLVLGLVPALFAAIGWALIPHPRRLATRILATLVIGSTAGVIGLAIIVPLLSLRTPDLALYLVFAFCGAIALTATALPWSKT